MKKIIIGFVFDPDGSFYLFDGKLIQVEGQYGHSIQALRNELTNMKIPMSIEEDFRYVCLAFSLGREYRVHRLDRTWPINKNGVTKHRVWPHKDRVFEGILRTTLIETS